MYRLKAATPRDSLYNIFRPPSGGSTNTAFSAAWKFTYLIQIQEIAIPQLGPRRVRVLERFYGPVVGECFAVGVVDAVRVEVVPAEDVEDVHEDGPAAGRRRRVQDVAAAQRNCYGLCDFWSVNKKGAAAFGMNSLKTTIHIIMF